MTVMVFHQFYMTQSPSCLHHQLLCHCVFICSNVRQWLVYLMQWLFMVLLLVD